jgi:hypothetical protein
VALSQTDNRYECVRVDTAFSGQHRGIDNKTTALSQLGQQLVLNESGLVATHPDGRLTAFSFCHASFNSLPAKFDLLTRRWEPAPGGLLDSKSQLKGPFYCVHFFGTTEG